MGLTNTADFEDRGDRVELLAEQFGLFADGNDVAAVAVDASVKRSKSSPAMTSSTTNVFDRQFGGDVAKRTAWRWCVRALVSVFVCL